jgi:HAD superfamily hydrolase (TIGR01509 family)
MIPHIVAFDLGKVLVDFDYSINARQIAARGTMPEEEIRKFIDHSPLLFQLETGRMTNEQFYEEVSQVTGFRGTMAEFSQYFADIFWPIEPMVAWSERLRARGIPTYIFSNTNGLAVTHIRRRFPFFSSFTGYIYSYEVGAMKPDPKMYEALERLAGKQGPEILYLDDRQENIEAGQARDWQVILQENPQKTLATVRQLGLPE